MKNIILTLSLSLILAFGGIIEAVAQEQPKPQKDTVNLDTDAKPKQYYAVEDEKTEAEKGSGKSHGVSILIIAASVIVVGGVAFFLLKKKK
jgi:hypothetical protein